VDVVELEILGVWDPPVYRIFVAPSRDVLVDRFIEITKRRFDGGDIYLVGGKNINDDQCVVKHTESTMTVDGMFFRDYIPADVQQLYILFGWLPIIKDNQMKTLFVFSASEHVGPTVEDVQNDYPHRILFRRAKGENLWWVHLVPYLKNVTPVAIIIRFADDALKSILEFESNTPP